MSPAVRPHCAAAPTPKRPQHDRRSRSHIEVTRLDDVLILRPQGGLDRSVVANLERSVAAATGPVVVDLDECVLVDPTAVRHVASAGPRDREVCIVSRRLSCRRLLARVGVTERLAVFQCLADALQARVLAGSGYGSGWSPG